MGNKQSRTRALFWITLAVLAMIFLTRMVTLMHNRRLHPDEHVFYLNTMSLLNSILHGTEFVENKEYPEGAYLLLMGFQLVGKIVRALLGIEKEIGVQHIGRFASVTYFAVSVLLGMRLIRRYLGKSNVSLVIYGLTMSFSLFFIEQSRYGTGDMISLMLLMLLLNLTARALEPGRQALWWGAAFFVCGVLGAVKYPLLVFVLIPLAAFLSAPGKGKAAKLGVWLLAVICGFFLFSPKAIFDHGYLLRVIEREGDAYLSPSASKNSGVLNHLVSVLLYMLVYSDFPLLPVLVLAGFLPMMVRFFKNRDTASHGSMALLFRVIIPGTGLFFFLYNLFVPLLFFRTLIPFFGILSLYTAVAAETLFCKNRWGRTAVLCLTVFMVLRGAALTWVMATDTKANEQVSAMAASAVDENWKETWYTCMFSLPLTDENGTDSYAVQHLETLLIQNDSYEIQPGQLVVTGAYEFYRGYRYLLPVSEDTNYYVHQWAAFKEANQDYLIGQLYPDYYYYLFGGWIRGGTLSQYEFPCHYLYYRSE